MFTLVWQLRRLLHLWIKKPATMKRLWKASVLHRKQARQVAKRVRESELRVLCRDSKSNKPSLPPYLERNRWEEELNYKLWITKGARFNAAKRCEEKDYAATWTNALLSCYLIIVGLIPFVPNPAFKDFSPDILSFVTTGVSIMLLAYGLIVATQRYPMQAIVYHECALKIGVLYNALRRAKELKNEDDKTKEILRISLEYDELLSRYPNHHALDSALFETSKRTYFKLSRWECFKRRRLYWFHTKAIHHFAILIPVLIVLKLWLATK
ncbi:MAG: SLATT domain-containing protein [Prosthecobacter sp.]|uniref:SLATT domain-containing protein n=1 Tax=Prosthecobacter sp. TaxID=1965333 RepID=UPI003BB0DCF7